METVTPKTDKEVELAYRAARKIARSFVRRYNSIMTPTADFEDYVQTGMVEWLEGRDMYWGMIRELRRSLEFSKYLYKVKQMPAPHMVEFEDDRHDRDLKDEIERKIDAQPILDKIYAIEDEQKQFALVAYFLLGLSLREIAQVFEKSHEWVRTYLIDPEIKRIREELVCPS